MEDSMNVAALRTTLDYGAWANARLFDQVAQLSPEQFVAEPVGALPSVRRILTHMLAAQTLWLARFRADAAASIPTEEEFPDLATLRQTWEKQRQALDGYVATLNDETLQGPFRFERRGVALTLPLWQIFMQLYGHGVQHRAEVAALLTDYGHSPGDLDFLFFVMSTN
jgi:uncharacterized damage-inducible protein DinB